jgi:hypothetical protein
MQEEDILDMRVDRTKISVSNSFDNTEEKEYWLLRTPLERLLHVERLRRIAYGYDENSEGLQRVLEIAERK